MKFGYRIISLGLLIIMLFTTLTSAQADSSAIFYYLTTKDNVIVYSKASTLSSKIRTIKSIGTPIQVFSFSSSGFNSWGKTTDGYVLSNSIKMFVEKNVPVTPQIFTVTKAEGTVAFSQPYSNSVKLANLLVNTSVVVKEKVTNAHGNIWYFTNKGYIYSGNLSPFDLLDSSIYLTQKTTETCTLCSSAVVLRRKAILKADTDWASITEDTLKSTAWGTKGLLASFEYKGIKMVCKQLPTGLKEKKAELINLMSSNPEGFLLYYKTPSGILHAVVVVGYDSNTGIFTVSDPVNSTNYKGALMPLSRAYPYYNKTISQDDILGYVIKVWVAD